MKPPLIIAHRGASEAAPENTLAAFRLAWEMKSDGIEVDLHLTADGELVVIHDASTTRTAGVEKVVAETTLEELKRLDFGSFRGGPWCGERLPTLREVLAIVPPGKRIFIEIKAGRALLPFLREELAAFASAQPCLMAFDEELLAEAKTLLPEVPCFWLTSAYRRAPVSAWPETTRQLMERCRARSFDGISIGLFEAKDLAAFCREARAWAETTAVLVWTVNDPTAAHALLRLPLHGIITDRPDMIRALPV